MHYMQYVNKHFYIVSLSLSLSISAMAAANLCEEEESKYFPAIVDGSCNLPVADSCFQLLNPCFDKVDQHCSLDVLPIILDEVSFPVDEKCTFQRSHGQDVYGISMLSEESKTTAQCTSQLAFLSLVELPVPLKNQTCLDPRLNCHNFIDLQMESADAYSPCVVDIDIEMENFEKPKHDDEAAGSIKSEGLLTGVLQRQASLKTCGKVVQLLVNQGSTLLKLISKDKSFTERVHDIPNNRWRRYKRAASFDSRKIVVLFSILSSLGTLVLIYLTLRVRQSADGFVNF